MKWKTQYKVHYYYTDYRGILKPSYTSRYMQETANNALKGWGPTPSGLVENNQAFILSKITFKFYKPVFEDEVIDVETWAHASGALIFTRFYRILRGEEIVAEAASSWVLVNIGTKQLLRTSELYTDSIQSDDEKLAFETVRRFKIPEELQFIGERRISFSDIDQNMHTNNTVYLDIIADMAAVTSDGTPMSGRRIAEMDIMYQKESPYGETLLLYRHEGERDESGASICVLRAAFKTTGEVCFDARATLVPFA